MPGAGMIELGVGIGGRIGIREDERPGGVEGGTIGIKGRVLEETPVGRTAEGVGTVKVEDSELAGRLGIDGSGRSGNSGPAQPNSIKWMATLHSFSSLNMGKRRLTEVAPPHCLFLTIVPSGEQRAVCLQMAPSGIPKEKTTSVSISVET